jgi:predicted branched-subunit amino acid permease
LSAGSFPPHRPVWREPGFAEGARDFYGVGLGVAAWGLVAGMAMAQSGLPLGWVIFMQLIVFSGTAQLAVLPLWVSGAPLWVVWTTALCVSLRFVFLSHAWRPYFIDQPLSMRLRLAYFAADINYVVFIRRFPQPEPGSVTMPYFWGGSLVNWFSWQIPSLVGIVLADAIPANWGIGFAGTVALTALTCALITDRRSWAVAGVAGAAAVAAFALPLKLNIVVAIAAAVAIGLLFQPPAHLAATSVGGAGADERR